MSKCNAIYTAQTDVKTVPPMSSIKNDNVATDELLYGIVGCSISLSGAALLHSDTKKKNNKIKTRNRINQFMHPMYNPNH